VAPGIGTPAAKTAANSSDVRYAGSGLTERTGPASAQRPTIAMRPSRSLSSRELLSHTGAVVGSAIGHVEEPWPGSLVASANQACFGRLSQTPSSERSRAEDNHR
jgi:hypothetical protein